MKKLSKLSFLVVTSALGLQSCGTTSVEHMKEMGPQEAYNEAMKCVEHGDYPMAVALLQLAQRDQSLKLPAIKALMNTYLTQKDYSRYIIEAESYILKDGIFDFDTRLNLIKVLSITGQNKRALEQLDQVFSLRPFDQSAIMAKAVILSKENKVSQSIDVLGVLIEKNPNYIDARLLRANYFGQQKKYLQALDDYSFVFNIDSNNRQAKQGIMDSRIGLEDYATALNDLNEIVLEWGSDKALLEKKSNLLSKLERVTEAQTVILELLKEDKNNLLYKTQLANNYIKMNNLTDALVIFHDLVRQDPKNQENAYSLVKLLLDQNMYFEAGEVLQAHCKAYPEAMWSAVGLKNLYLKLGKSDLAVEILEEHVRHNKETSGLVELAKLYSQIGKADLALANLESALKLEPGNLVLKQMAHDVAKGEIIAQGNLVEMETEFGAEEKEKRTIANASINESTLEKAQSIVPFLNVIVQAGDTLQKLAKKFYGRYSKWHVIYNSNKDVIKDINTIPVGTSLQVPTKGIVK